MPIGILDGIFDSLAVVSTSGPSSLPWDQEGGKSFNLLIIRLVSLVTSSILSVIRSFPKVALVLLTYEIPKALGAQYQKLEQRPNLFLNINYHITGDLFSNPDSSIPASAARGYTKLNSALFSLWGVPVACSHSLHL